MPAKLLSVSAIALLITCMLQAQSDTSALNTGNVQVSGQFTQNITIKGEDLERFPFSSLDEAINIYFNGAYSDSLSLLYIIDGNSSADVNAYSIYDIESITLVQDARRIISGVHRAQQLILIRTRTGLTGKSGFNVAGSSYLTKRR